MSSFSSSSSSQQTPQIALAPLHAFGINGPIRDTILTYKDSKASSDQVIFPAANFVVSLDSETKTTQFFEPPQPGSVHNGITALTISRNGKNVAAAYQCRGGSDAGSSQSGDGAQVIVYRTSNRKRVASFLHKSKVTCMCFSGDSKQLIVAAVDSLNIWSWENQKLDYSAAFEGDISRVSCPTADGQLQSSSSTLLISTTGQGYCRLWIASTRHRLANSMISPVSEQKYNYRDHTWLSNVHNDQNLFLAIVTEPLLKDENGVYNLPCPQETTVNIFKIADGISSSRPRAELHQAIPTDLKKGMHIICITAARASPGFILGGSNGTLLLFHEEDCDGKHSFSNTKRISNGRYGGIVAIQNRNTLEKSILICSEDRIIHEVDIGDFKFQDSNCSCSDFFTDTGHIGGIEDIDCGVEKPYLASCGNDNTIRIWNLDTRECILSEKSDIDEPQTVAIHPLGFQIAVGYKDKLVMYYVLVDGLKAYRELQCRSPIRCVRFSEGGQYLAAVCGNTISVYRTYQHCNTYTFSLVTSFIGHVGAIKYLTWSHNTIFSSGLDRNIYVWDMNNGARIDNMNVLRSFGICESMAIIKSRNPTVHAVACTTDGNLHAIQWSGKLGDESKVTTLSANDGDKITTVCLSEDETIVFAGTFSGSVYIYSWDSGATQAQVSLSLLQKMSLHCNNSMISSTRNSISCMMSRGSQLISAGGLDGVLLLSTLKSSAYEQQKSIVTSPISNDDGIIVVSTDEFESTKDTIAELEERIKTMKSDYQFSIHSKETLWKNELTELTQKTDEVVDAER